MEARVIREFRVERASHHMTLSYSNRMCLIRCEYMYTLIMNGLNGRRTDKDAGYGRGGGAVEWNGWISWVEGDGNLGLKGLQLSTIEISLNRDILNRQIMNDAGTKPWSFQRTSPPSIFGSFGCSTMLFASKIRPAHVPYFDTEK